MEFKDKIGMPAGLYHKNLKLGICFRLIMTNVFQWSDG